MTIIVAFILDAFVFRMNYSRKNREQPENPEGGTTLILLTDVIQIHVLQIRIRPVVVMSSSVH